MQNLSLLRSIHWHSAFSNLTTENIINQVVHYELTKAQILPVDAATIVAALNKICTRLIGLHVAMCNAHLIPCLLLHFIAVISAKCINSFQTPRLHLKNKGANMKLRTRFRHHHGLPCVGTRSDTWLHRKDQSSWLHVHKFTTVRAVQHTGERNTLNKVMFSPRGIVHQS